MMQHPARKARCSRLSAGILLAGLLCVSLVGGCLGWHIPNPPLRASDAGWNQSDASADVGGAHDAATATDASADSPQPQEDLCSRANHDPSALAAGCGTVPIDVPPADASDAPADEHAPDAGARDGDDATTSGDADDAATSGDAGHADAAATDDGVAAE